MSSDLQLVKILASIDRRLENIEKHISSGFGVNVGDGRILTRIQVGSTIISYLVPANDRLIVPHIIVNGNHEPNISNYFAREIKPDSHFIDIGANFGYYTCLAGRLATEGKIIGIEPDRLIWELLRDNIFINFIEGRATALCAAANSTETPLTLTRRLTRSGNTSIIWAPEEFTTAMGEPPAERFEAQGVTVDSLLPQMDGRIDFIKLDAEGAEPLVFRGAHQAIEQNPEIKIIMEWSPAQIISAGFSIDEFVNDIKRFGFNPAIPTHDNSLWEISLDFLKTQNYHSGVLFTRTSTA